MEVLKALYNKIMNTYKTFKELLRFYKKHGSAMHVTFLDASKAFDRVNRRKLLLTLESRGVPT